MGKGKGKVSRGGKAPVNGTLMGARVKRVRYEVALVPIVSIMLKDGQSQSPKAMAFMCHHAIGSLYSMAGEPTAACNPEDVARRRRMAFTARTRDVGLEMVPSDEEIRTVIGSYVVSRAAQSMARVHLGTYDTPAEAAFIASTSLYGIKPIEAALANSALWDVLSGAVKCCIASAASKSMSMPTSGADSISEAPSDASDVSVAASVVGMAARELLRLHADPPVMSVFNEHYRPDSPHLHHCEDSGSIASFWLRMGRHQAMLIAAAPSWIPCFGADLSRGVRDEIVRNMNECITLIGESIANAESALSSTDQVVIESAARILTQCGAAEVFGNSGSGGDSDDDDDGGQSADRIIREFIKTGGAALKSTIEARDFLMTDKPAREGGVRMMAMAATVSAAAMRWACGAFSSAMLAYYEMDSESILQGDTDKYSDWAREMVGKLAESSRDMSPQRFSQFLSERVHFSALLRMCGVIRNSGEYPSQEVMSKMCPMPSAVPGADNAAMMVGDNLHAVISMAFPAPCGGSLAPNPDAPNEVGSRVARECGAMGWLDWSEAKVEGESDDGLITIGAISRRAFTVNAEKMRDSFPALCQILDSGGVDVGNLAVDFEMIVRPVAEIEYEVDGKPIREYIDGLLSADHKLSMSAMMSRVSAGAVSLLGATPHLLNVANQDSIGRRKKKGGSDTH